MKTTRKVVLAVLAAMLIVVTSVGATLAYLTDTDADTNTFTVGNIDLILDEGRVDEDGKFVDQVNDRVHENEYHLIPGMSYDKDPIVHVQPNSEDAWVFVTIENGIEEIESKADGYVSINDQPMENGWTALEEGVYYVEHPKSASITDYVVFKGFTIDGDSVVNVQEGEEVPDGKFDIAEYTTEENDTLVKVTAYAIQKAGFDTAEEAWAMLKDVLNIQ